MRERWVRVVLISVFIDGTAMFGALAYVGADLNTRFGLGASGSVWLAPCWSRLASARSCSR
jgi:hypothetical protein